MNRQLKARMIRHNRQVYRRARRWRYVLVVSMVSQILLAATFLGLFLASLLSGASLIPASFGVVGVIVLLVLYAFHAWAANNLDFEDDRKSVRGRVGL